MDGGKLFGEFMDYLDIFQYRLISRTGVELHLPRLLLNIRDLF